MELISPQEKALSRRGGTQIECLDLSAPNVKVYHWPLFGTSCQNSWTSLNLKRGGVVWEAVLCYAHLATQHSEYCGV